jgi:hypothetical protein
MFIIIAVDLDTAFQFSFDAFVRNIQTIEIIESAQGKQNAWLSENLMGLIVDALANYSFSTIPSTSLIVFDSTSVNFQDHKTFRYSYFGSSKVEKPRMLGVICSLSMGVAVSTTLPGYFGIL